MELKSNFPNLQTVPKLTKASRSLSTDFIKLSIFVYRSASNTTQPAPGRRSNPLFSADFPWLECRTARVKMVQYQGQAELKLETRKCCRKILTKKEKNKYK